VQFVVIGWIVDTGNRSASLIVFCIVLSMSSLGFVEFFIAQQPLQQLA